MAEDIEQAKRIAFGAKRFRVVTLGGDLIETSGAMSGGGKEKMSGKMGAQIAMSKKNEVNLDALEAKLHEEEFKLRQLNTQRGEANEFWILIVHYFHVKYGSRACEAISVHFFHISFPFDWA